MAIVSACLFLYVGFGLGLVGMSGDAIYDGSVTALVWGSRVVGIGLLITAGLSYTRLAIGLLLDLVVSALAAGGCLLIGVIWLFYGDMQGILLLLFGVMNASAARGAWVRWTHERPERNPLGKTDGGD